MQKLFDGATVILRVLIILARNLLVKSISADLDLYRLKACIRDQMFYVYSVWIDAK